ncbi:right-handed parallel beta-helix repeat-containing protein [Bremerella sp. JC770]|uniref:right-handed parallel beta-helix repeat-containing protein n=1 Tax=Bremerella sp. JC770 TaxID=3232137 RepID=UPI00345A403A
MLATRVLFFSLVLCLNLLPLGLTPLTAADWHVDPTVGSDANEGSQSAPLETIQAAINKAAQGDVIHLHPQGAVYRQSAHFRTRTGITIEGNGVTLDGADPLPSTGWEEVEAGLFRRKLRRTALDRHLLLFDGRMERMGRTQSSNSPEFPPVDELMANQFCFENIDETSGWLYVRGDVSNLQWATRVNGVATSGKCRDLVVRNLRARNFLNDGFNVHGDCRVLRFENIAGFDCFDEGFSAHESAECSIDGGLFYGNENGVADVNEAETHYRNCEFFGNVNVDVMLIGRTHSLIDCQIINTTSASALVAGPRSGESSFSLLLERVSIQTRDKQEPARVRLDGGEVTIDELVTANVEMNTTGAEVTRVKSEPTSE